MVRRIFGLLNRAMGGRDAYAHCDVPCGIYDPHAAQIAALTVVRMCQLANNLAMPASGSGDKAAYDTYGNSMARYIVTKENHAEICKKEIDILWHDYFRPEHLE